MLGETEVTTRIPDTRQREYSADEETALSVLNLAQSEAELSKELEKLATCFGVERLDLARCSRLNLLNTSSVESDVGVPFFPGHEADAVQVTDGLPPLQKVLDQALMPAYPFSALTASGDLELIDLTELLSGRPVQTGATYLLSYPLEFVDRRYFLVVKILKRDIRLKLINGLNVLLSNLDQNLRRILSEYLFSPAKLSARERQVLRWCCQGKTSFEIAKILQLSEFTVNNYFANLTKKLGAANRSQAIAIGIFYQLF